MKKLIGIILSAAVLSMGISIAAAEPVTTQTAVGNSVEVTSELGSAYANKTLTVMILSPGETIENLKSGDSYNNITEADILKTLNTIVTATADSAGKITFTYEPGETRGVYKMRIMGEGIYTPIETSFVFTKETDAQDKIDELKADSATKEDFAAVFDKYDSEEVYAAYQILGLDKATMYEAFDKADADKERICVALHAERAELTDPQSLINKFNEKTFWALIGNEDLEGYLAKYGDEIDYKNCNFYKNIYEKKLASEEDKEKINDKLAQIDFLKETNPLDTLEEAVVFTVISETSSYTVLGDLVSAVSAYLETKGLDYSIYDDEDLSKLRTLYENKPYTDLEDFAEKFNDAFAIATSGSGVSTETSSGTIGGGGGGKTSNVFVGKTSAVTNEGVKEEAKEEIPFTDMAEAQWAKEAVTYLWTKGIINGKTETVFAPNAFITRAEFAKIITEAFDYKPATPDFEDVSENAWYADYVGALQSAGVMVGNGGYFNPDSNITRQEVVTVIYRIVGKETVAGKAGFADYAEIADWAKAAVDYCAARDIVGGVGDNMFAPQNNATRAEVAKIIYKIITE